MKRTFAVGVALLVALAAGWLWGASGASTARRAVESADLRDDLHEARAAVLDARLDLYSVNFGEASRHFETARTALKSATGRLQNADQEQHAARLVVAATRIAEAQRLTGELNQDANSHAAAAAAAIGEVLGAHGTEAAASAGAR